MTGQEHIAKQERLMSAWDSYLRLDRADDGTVEHARKCICAQNRLIDACVDCGMPVDGDEFEFAASAVTLFLVTQ